MNATAVDLAIRGGTLVTTEERRRADLGIRDGIIVSVGEVGDARSSIDAEGLFVLPGAIDVHTHLRLPTDSDPDRFFADTSAAVAGGTTTVLSFIEQPRGSSLKRVLDRWLAATSGEAASDFGLNPILTDLEGGNESAIPAIIDAGCPTMKAFMVYEEFRLSDEELYRAMELVTAAGGMMMVHCENDVLLRALIRRHLARGETSPRHHALSRPALIEAEATHRALCMAEIANAPLYIVHLSCTRALEKLRSAKESGQTVHAETCPHYLTLTSDRYRAPNAEAARFVISPPLREETDRASLWEALAEGILEVVGSDHVPRRLAEEGDATDFTRIPNGAPGIQTLAGLIFSEGVMADRIPPERMVAALSANPARLFGLERKGSLDVGKDADIVLWDPESRHRLSQVRLRHSADFTPYEGMTVRGSVETTILRGEIVAERGQYVGSRGQGKFVARRLPRGGGES